VNRAHLDGLKLNIFRAEPVDRSGFPASVDRVDNYQLADRFIPLPAIGYRSGIDDFHRKIEGVTGQLPNCMNSDPFVLQQFVARPRQALNDRAQPGGFVGQHEAPPGAHVLLTGAELQLLLSGLDLAKLRPRRWVRRTANAETQAVAADAACQ